MKTTGKGATQVTISNRVRIIGDLPFDVTKYLQTRLTFINPKWTENEKHGYWQGDTPKELTYLERTEAGLIIPRGFSHQLLTILNRNNVKHAFLDRTRALPKVSFAFQKNLYPFQQEAVEAIRKRRYGILESPPGSGKTVMALYLIAERRQPALLICHTKELMYQWRDRAVEFLGLPEEEIGLIGDGQRTPGARLTIGIVNSVYKLADRIQNKIGFLIVDECHRTPSRTFTEAVSAFDSRYMLGLSATPYRRDGLTRLIYFFIGDRLHRIEPKTLQDLDRIMTPKLLVTETDFNYAYADDYQAMITALTEDPDRNRLIVGDVLEASCGRPSNIRPSHKTPHETLTPSNGDSITLIISDRKEHCATLYGLLKDKRPSAILTGDLPSKERKRIVEELGQGSVKVLIATSQLIGEGFDLKSLSTIFLATPIKFNGRVKQYTGRILRTAGGKREAVIYDYLDRPGVLQAAFKSRMYAYRELGIEQEEAGRED